jgi:hypothetical protein
MTVTNRLTGKHRLLTWSRQFERENVIDNPDKWQPWAIRRIKRAIQDGVFTNVPENKIPTIADSLILFCMGGTGEFQKLAEV